MRRIRRLCLLGVLVVLAFVPARAASAHAVLLRTEPAEGTVVAAPPAEVRMYFSEGVSAAANGVRVVDPRGQTLSSVEARSEGDVLAAELPELTIEGTYTVAWNAISADGHPVSGAWTFSWGRATASAAAATAAVAAAAPAGPPGWLRFLEVVGLAIAFCGVGLVGGSSVLGRRLEQPALLAVPGPWPWAAAAAGVVLALAAAAGALVAGGTLVGSVPGLLVSGIAGVCLAAAFVPSAAGMAAPPRPWTGWFGLGALLLLAGAGHALVLAPRVVGYSLQVVHVVAVATWGAGVVWLVRTLRRGPEPVFTRARAFSPIATVCVVVAAATGIALLLLRVPLSDLLDTNYGRLGLVKVGLLVVVAAVGGINRWGWVRRRRVGPLAWSMRAEVVLLAGTVLVGALLGTTPPPLAAAPPETAPAVQSAQGPLGPYVASITLGPAAVGANDLHVTVVRPDGAPATDLENLHVELRDPDAGIGPLRPAVSPVEPGHVAAIGAVVPLAGRWDVDVVADRGRFQRLRATLPVEVR